MKRCHPVLDVVEFFAITHVAGNEPLHIFSRISVSDKRNAYLSHIDPSIPGLKLRNLMDEAINVTMQGRLLLLQCSGDESGGKHLPHLTIFSNVGVGCSTCMISANALGSRS